MQLAWCLFGYIFNKYIRSKYLGWWMQYNYIVSAGLDVGLALCAIILFFCVQLPGGSMPDYWGTTIIERTVDGAGTAVRKIVGEGEIFGPKTWKW
jgi:hypothetical protein